MCVQQVSYSPSQASRPSIVVLLPVCLASQSTEKHRSTGLRQYSLVGRKASSFVERDT